MSETSAPVPRLRSPAPDCGHFLAVPMPQKKTRVATTTLALIIHDEVTCRATSNAASPWGLAEQFLDHFTTIGDFHRASALTGKGRFQ